MKSINEITKEEIEYYYNETNHSQRECANYFNLSVGLFIHLLKEKGIKKDKSKHVEQIKKSKLERYGDEHYNNREAAKSTCMKRYGVDNIFKDTKKIKQSYIDTLGVDHPMHSESIKNKVLSKHNYDESLKKARDTYQKKTGYDNPSKNPEVIKKMLESKIKNGCYESPGSSNIEKRLEKILNRKFKIVISKYHDSRYCRNSGYMYECDFYIPEEDLFIELNAHPAHYNCPYNKDNSSHLALAEKYRYSDKKWENQIYETWAIRDAEKQACAKDNQLNYLVLYPLNTIQENKKFNHKKYADLIEYLIKKLNKG